MIVLDASAVMALLLREPGWEAVKAKLQGAVMTTVNLAEVVGQFARIGSDHGRISAMLTGLSITYLPADQNVAIEAGLMQALTASVGLSLGDRFCLAQAKRLNGTALTADRPWASVADALGVKVELIR